MSTGFAAIGKLEDLPIQRFNLFQTGVTRVAAGAHVRQSRRRKGINILFFHTDIAQARRDIDVAIQLRHRLNGCLTRFGNRQSSRLLVAQGHRDVAIFFASIFGVVGHDMRQQHRVSHAVRRTVERAQRVGHTVDQPQTNV